MTAPRIVLALAVCVLLLAILLPEASPSAPRMVKVISVFPASMDRTVPLDAATPDVPSVPTTGGWIGPGAHLIMTMDSQPGVEFGCTADFLWTDGTTTYLGAAGHCFLPPDATATAGPGADYDPAHTHVKVCVASCEFGGQAGFIAPGTTVALGPVAYARQSDNGVDIGNDFGLVVVPSAQLPRTTPAMPVWGGPTTAASPSTGTLACLYGNAEGMGEVFATKARAGVLTSLTAKSWGAVMAAFEGDSGSAVVTCTADATGVHGVNAVGILTHLTVGLGTRDVAGTTIPRAEQMATEAGLHVTPILASS